MTFGLTPAGFVPKLIGDIEAQITSAMRANVDPNFDMSPDQPIGQMGSVSASIGAELWELIAACYSGLNPNNQEGFILDGGAAYTGTKRKPATYSQVICAMGLNGTTTVPAGSLANVSGQPSNTWQLLGPANPTTGLLISNGPVVSTTAGTYYGMFQATSTGPVVANAGQLSVITAAVSGGNGVVNSNDATLGNALETDTQLQVRREAELSASGGSTTDAMRANLLNVPGVIQAYVTENTSDVTDANGLAPHSIHVIVYDGLSPNTTIMNPLIAAVIWKYKGSGCAMKGAVAVQTPDSTGTLQTVQFDRATIVPFWISMSAGTDSTFDSINGPGATKAALVAYWDSVQNLNQPVPIDDMRAITTLTLPGNPYKIRGIFKVTSFTIGLAPSPVGTSDLPAALTTIYTLSTSDILFNGV